MPFADARDMAMDMRRYPPRHIALAIMAHWKPPADAESSEMTADDVRELRAAVGGVHG